MVGLHKEHYGKGPTKARTIMAEDTVVCRLEDPFVRAEKTLISMGREDEIRNMRAALSEELRPEFVSRVERLTGRPVLAFISEIHTNPDMAVELFVLEATEEVPGDPSAEQVRE